MNKCDLRGKSPVQYGFKNKSQQFFVNSTKFFWLSKKNKVLLNVGAASSRDLKPSRLEAAPTEGLAVGNLDFPD